MKSWDPYEAAARERRGSMLPVLAVVAVASILVLFLWRPWASPLHDPNAEPRTVTPRGDLAPLEEQTVELFRKVSPCVVFISTLRREGGRSIFDPTRTRQGTGSGFVWDRRGYVVTNYHVVQGASQVNVTLASGETYRARLVGKSPLDDLAVVKVDPKNGRALPEISVGSSGDLQVGQSVFAIGNPFGFDHTLTTGVISGVGRELEGEAGVRIDDLIQTDCAINPGNSGGPLLDSSGRLIGVNTAIVSPSGTSAGLGFAVPVDQVNRVVPQLIEKGRIVIPGIGVAPLSEKFRKWIGLEGVAFTYVQAGGPADRAGLRRTVVYDSLEYRLGDVIVGIDGEPVRSLADMREICRDREVGERVTLKVRRGGETREVTLALIDVYGN